MRGRTTSICITVLVILFVLATIPVAVSSGQGLADTPWPCAGRDTANTHFSPYDINDSGEKVYWTFDTERSITSTPVIGEDEIYVGSVDNKLYSISSSGMLRWHFTADSDVRSSPLLGSDDTIYLLSWEGTLYSLDMDGSLRWKVESNSRPGGPPIMDNEGYVYFAASNGMLYAVDPDGEISWTFDTVQRLAASPAMGRDGTLYIGTTLGFEDTEGKVYAISREGQEIWSRGVPISITSAATLGTNGNIYVGSSDGRLFALSDTGNVLWTYNTDNKIVSSPALKADGSIYISSFDRHIHAVRPDGSLDWKYETDGYISASPTVSGDGKIVVGSSDGYLYILEEDGTLDRKIDLGSPVLSSASIGSDGTIYVGNSDGRLFALTCEENLRPSPPRNLQEEITEEKHVNLTWNPSQRGDPTHYNIYRQTGNESEVYIGSVQSTHLYYIDHSVEAGKDYTYRITAENDVGESTPSAAVTISIPEEKDDDHPIELFIAIGIISALAAVSLILTLKILKMKKLEREHLLGDTSQEKDKEKPVTCPFCGHFYMERGGKDYGRCPQCKNMIHPSVF